MYKKPYRDNKRSGGFGGAKRFGGGSNDRPMYPATCVKCGERCEVPFKPNGSKPVYCSKCYVRDDASAPRRFDGPRPTGRFERPSSGPSDVSEQLKAINAKLDAIIEALES